MSNCKKCKQNKCGCGSSAIEMPPVYLNCPNPCESTEKCTQLYNMDCICYDGEDIIELDIKKGERMTSIMKKLISAILYPGCSDYSSVTACKNTVNVIITNIGANSLSIEWNEVNTAVNYIVEFKLSSSLTWNTLPAVNVTNASIVGLTAESIYDIRVIVTCAATTCASLQYRIKTLIN